MTGEPITRELRILLRAFMALAFGAFILLFVFSENTDDSFSWTIKPPLTAAFLGASYLGAFILFWWTARRGDWEAARAALVPVTVIALLLLVATIIHEDRFHDDLFGWFWRIVYLLAPLAIAAAVTSQVRTRRGFREPAGASAGPQSPLPTELRALLLFQGITMLAIGVYLFVAPDSADALWPWNLTPLTARAIGSFVTGFGVSALHAIAANDLTRFAGAAVAYAGLAVMQLIGVARYSGDMTGGDADTAIYVAFLFSVLLAGLYGWSCVRRSSSSAASRSA
jgi:hypothetical protein